jgi:acetoin utilization deacetylase AcuC-like enzyme
MYSLTENAIRPQEVSWELLGKYHDPEHLQKLQTDRKYLYWVYEYKSRLEDVNDKDIKNLLDPARREVGGTILMSHLASIYKTAFFIGGGGMHHASCDVSEGSSLFVDIPISWIMFKKPGQKALYIDLDVHHGNGIALAKHQLKLEDSFFIIDLYNDTLFPLEGSEGEKLDNRSLSYVNIKKPFKTSITNEGYLKLLREALDEAPKDFTIIYYMANNDVLGKKDFSQVNEQGIFERNDIVFNWARALDIPIAMFANNGYSKHGCERTYRSLKRLEKFFM